MPESRLERTNCPARHKARALRSEGAYALGRIPVAGIEYRTESEKYWSHPACCETTPIGSMRISWRWWPRACTTCV